MLAVTQSIALVAVSLISPAVYLDATHHRIGKIREAGHTVGTSAGAWAVLTMIPGINFLFLIGYAISRPGLLRNAKAHLVEVPRTRRIITYWLILGISTALTSLYWLNADFSDPLPTIQVSPSG